MGGSGSDGAGTAPPPQPSPFAGTEHPFQYNALEHPFSCSTRPVHCIVCMLLSDKKVILEILKPRTCRENMYLYVLELVLQTLIFRATDYSMYIFSHFQAKKLRFRVTRSL